MNCEVAHERIVTATYGELLDEHAHELERHMAGCPDCENERKQITALKVLASAYPVIEPGPNLIARSRLRLEEALDALPPMRWYERMAQRMVNSFASLRAAPAAVLLLLVAGGGIGSLAGYEFAQYQSIHQTSAAAAQPQTASVREESNPSASGLAHVSEVSSITSIHRVPNSRKIEVRYSLLVPGRVEGSFNNPAIRRLVMLASEDSASVHVRDDSVTLMADECRTGHNCRPSGILDALMVALLYDSNPQVRMTALHGLEPYVTQDMRVRDAVLEALLNDSNPAIRTEAITILEPAEADTSVRQVLSAVARSDNNPQIRMVSREVLSRAPLIQ
jgi:hypothetical protein